MGSIPKKPRSVKRQKGTKKPPRFTIKKDSLGRRYAIDKRTGKRAPVSKAKKEQERRKKVTVTFRGIVDKKRSRAAKKGWETRKRKSEAAKKGWETRRKKVTAEPIKRIPSYERPLTFGEIRMRILGGLADRAERYPKVAAVTQLAWTGLQVDAFTRFNGINEGTISPDSLMNTPRFDRLYGEGHGTHVRYDYLANAQDLDDLDQIIDNLDQAEDNEYTARELYTLYFSPEVA